MSMGLRNPWFHQAKVFSYCQQVIRFSYLLPWRMIILHAISPELSRRCFWLLCLICSVMRTRKSMTAPHRSWPAFVLPPSILQPLWWLLQWLLYATVTANSVQQILSCFQTFGWRAYTAAHFFRFWGQAFPEWDVKCVKMYLDTNIS